MKKNTSTIILILVLIIGLSLLLYPSLSNYWNARHQTKAVTSYNQEITEMSEVERQNLWDAAVAYNQQVRARGDHFTLSEAEREQYISTLNPDGSGMMGYVEIPAIKVTLPVYHGTSDSVLRSAVGHLEWSSLPVGGSGTHCVLSGHRGLPSAKLFTNLDKLAEGDTFILRVLDEALTYEVDQILIVEPQDVDALRIIDGGDYCTLVTCTPYGINTPRLLVRGHRVENTEEAHTVYVTADAMQIEPLLVAPAVAIPILLVLLVMLLLPKPSKKKSGGDNDEDI